MNKTVSRFPSHDLWEGSTTSGITYPGSYRVDSVLPAHTHQIFVGTSSNPSQPGSPTNGFIQGTATFNYETGSNYNDSPRNEARHLQVIRCVAKKSIPEPPVGSIQYILAPNAQPSELGALGVLPNNYLIPSGQNIDRTTYSELFNRIGTKFGTGDGSTTFGLPNFLGLFSRGAEASDYITTSGTDLPASGYLGDTLVEHLHGRSSVVYSNGGDGFPQAGSIGPGTGNVASSDSNIGGAEVRPKNITAVYYLVAKGNY